MNEWRDATWIIFKPAFISHLRVTSLTHMWHRIHVTFTSHVTHSYVTPHLYHTYKSRHSLICDTTFLSHLRVTSPIHGCHLIHERRHSLVRETSCSLNSHLCHTYESRPSLIYDPTFMRDDTHSFVKPHSYLCHAFICDTSFMGDGTHSYVTPLFKYEYQSRRVYSVSGLFFPRRANSVWTILCVGCKSHVAYMECVGSFFRLVEVWMLQCVCMNEREGLRMQ